ncbi:hypothetical protein HK103_006084 [Boothiomyces macroporosus]|uniref:SH3 domain-containing protein n=1 Tax=Boothiomyces macroporosus TaxID=261099 RepID=A0AAD5UE41_9FUNG|nr:hypothetical protein HK103_006084 [Boothiomyces macroporosus]
MATFRSRLYENIITELDYLNKQKLISAKQYQEAMQLVKSQLPTFIAKYDYEAAESDELSIVEGDFLQVIGTIDENWVQAVNFSSRKTGLVPLSYISAE